MKTKLFAFVTILISSLFVIVNAQITRYEWDYVSTLQNEWLRKIWTQGLDTVYVVGNNGLIAQSTDRSLTWTKKYPVTAQLNDIIFCNHTTGFAVGNYGTILKTTDGGVNWTVQNSGITNNLNAIAATGLDNIWAVGDNGTALFSTDGGLTWQQKNFSVSVKLNDVSFKNNEGYIVGDAHTCFFSSDKGINWNFKDMVVKQQYVPDRPANDFSLLSVNQTANHTCILYSLFDIQRGMSINVDNNITIYPRYGISNFTMKNDTIGCGSTADCIAGSSGVGYISVQIFNLNKIDSNSTYDMEGAYTFSEFDFDTNHSDMSFVNDSIGYLACGSLFYRLKKYIPPVIIDGLTDTENRKISIRVNLNRLDVLFENTKVERIELYSITGLKVLTENVSSNETSKSLDITDLSKGTYIIRVCYRDNTFANTKWIRQ